ncbi:MAG: 23S rRNA (adenine(2503)-C(2))-methyltransferase RlmN [Elusimicrobiota bacterium]
MDAIKVREALKRLKQPSYRLTQILRAVYQDGASSYEEVTALPKQLRADLAKRAPVLSFTPKKVFASASRRAYKALLRLADGKLVESVLLRPKPSGDWSACVSSQVGCAMGCIFCATGVMGLRRNLSAEEIADQVLFWRQYLRRKRLGGRLSNVVYMGMGEPLHNIDNVLSSLRILLDPERLGLAARHVSVSTVGILPGMKRLIEAFPQVNLAVSLHAATERLRSRLVPVNKAYPLEQLAETLSEVLAKTRRKIFLEYVLIAGENDGKKNAQELIRFLHKTGRADLLHVNLIAWNPIDTPLRAPTRENAQQFRDWLRGRGATVTIRKSLGMDIRGACGQLISEQ